MLKKAENASTTVKWTMVGVMNIFKPFGFTLPPWADKVMTMNVNPVSAAADEPAMTKKLSQPARGEVSIIDSRITLSDIRTEVTDFGPAR